MGTNSNSIPKHVGIALIAPGGYPPDELAYLRAIERLQSQGYSIRSYYDPAQKFQRFGGTDEARIEQLYAAADDPDVRIVMAVRGGYGMSRLLPLLDFTRLATSGKLFVGHSDITALQMGLLAHGGMSFAGPMMCDDFTRDDTSAFTMRQFWNCISSPAHTVTGAAELNPALNVSGTLWGGNLAMLNHLVGTPYLPQVDGGILFVEDINEHPYRVERMLLQLFNAGILARQKALLLGDFSGYRLTDYDNGYDFDALLRYLRARLPVPVVSGLAFGHISDKVTLAVGCQATLSVEGNEFQLAMTGYPSL